MGQSETHSAGAASGVPKSSSTWRGGNGAVAAVIAMYVVLALVYSVASPILEASDENSHAGYLWQLAAGRGLPVLNVHDAHRYLDPKQEAGQPPLYYLITGVLTGWAVPAHPAQTLVLNPNPDVGHPDRSNWNKNLVVPSPEQDFPWRGVALEIHLARLVGILSGVATLLAIAQLALLVRPERRSIAVLAVALTAFNPMFLFVSASVDNDGMAIALSSWAFLLGIRQLRVGLNWRLSAGAGLLVGLAALTKLSAGAVGVPVAVAIAAACWQRRNWQTLLTNISLVVAIPAVLTSWWFVRNVALYHDFVGLSTFVAVAGPRPQPFTFATFVSEWPSIWEGFWGIFGLFDITLPAKMYWVYVAVTWWGFVGCAVTLSIAVRLRRGFDFSYVLLVGWPLLEFVLLLRWTSATYASSGRLEFPAIAAVCVLLAIGVDRLSIRLVSGSLLPVGLGALAASVIPLVLVPAYAVPSPVAEADLRPATRANISYGALDLVGISFGPTSLSPGEDTSIRLYWLSHGPTPANVVYSVQVYSVERQLLAQEDVLPGSGKLRTASLHSGFGIVDDVPLHIAAAAKAPELATIAVVVYPLGDAGHPIAPLGANGKPADPVVVRVPVSNGATPPAIPSEAPLFAAQIALVHAAVPPQAARGSNLMVSLVWQAVTMPTADYTLFVHVQSADGKIAAQLDGRPRGGALPTNVWITGQQVADQIAVPLPPSLTPGSYSVHLGWYQLASGKRLQLATGSDDLSLAQVDIQ